jgi:chromosome segregation ATPase
MRAEGGVLGSQDLGTRSPSGVVTTGPWMARDAFVAETAVTIDRLLAKVERLERREEALEQRVSELTEGAQQASRLQALSESLRNSRDYKVGELTRQIKDLRARLDSIEGPRTALGSLQFKTLADIDHKLTELAILESRSAAMVRRLQTASLAVGFLVATVLSLAAGFLL